MRLWTRTTIEIRPQILIIYADHFGASVIPQSLFHDPWAGTFIVIYRRVRALRTGYYTDFYDSQLIITRVLREDTWATIKHHPTKTE
jgi:hypothetical protein